VYQKALAHRGAQRVYHLELPVRELLGDQLGRQKSRITGAGKAGRKGDMQQVMALGENTAEELGGILWVCSGGGGQSAPTKLFIELMAVHGAVALIVDTLQAEAQRQNGDIVFLAVGQRQVSTAVGG
jgi:hypothetical protein